jgi:hypothetical protein
MILMGIEKQKDTLKFLWQLTLEYNRQSFIRSSSRYHINEANLWQNVPNVEKK